VQKASAAAPNTIKMASGRDMMDAIALLVPLSLLELSPDPSLDVISRERDRKQRT
jgi:hypothetical protein